MLSDQDHMAAKWSAASEDDLAAMLRWQVEMGVDIAVGDHPRDHFAEARAKAAQAPAPAAALTPDATAPGPRKAPRPDAPAPTPIRAPAAIATVSPDEAILAAEALCAAAPTLEALAAAFGGFDGCVLKRSASHLVFAEGNAAAQIMFVGDVPGEQDDREGRPFSGAPGRMFEAMLKSIGLDRTRVHAVNVIPWRPPGKRDPYPHEIAACLPFLQRYLALAQPKLVVTLGGLPLQHLIGAKEPITRTRGKWFEIAAPGSQTIPALAMLHPDYLLKAPATKRHAWADLRALRKALVEKGLA